MSSTRKIRLIRFVERRSGKKVGTDFSRFQFSLQDYPVDKEVDHSKVRWSKPHPVGGAKFKSLIRQGRLADNAFPHFKLQNGRVIYDKSFAKKDGLTVKRDFKSFDFKDDDVVTFNVKFYVRSDDFEYLKGQKYRDDKYSEQRIPFEKNVVLVPILRREYTVTSRAEDIRRYILRHKLPLSFKSQKVYDDFWSLLKNSQLSSSVHGKFELDKGSLDSIRNNIYAYITAFRLNPMARNDPLSYRMGVAHDDYLMNVRGWTLSSDYTKKGICKFYSSKDEYSTFPRGGCLYILLYYVFRDAFAKEDSLAQKKRKSSERCYMKERKYEDFCISKIYKIIHGEKDVPDSDDYDKWGLSFEQVCRFLEYCNAEGGVWDGFEGKFRTGFNIGRGSHHMPKFFYVYANQHAFLISEHTQHLSMEINRILERISSKLDIDVKQNYEDSWRRFKLPLSHKETDEYLFTDDIPEMVSLLGVSDIEKPTHIMTNLDLADVFIELWKVHHIKPCIESHGNSITRLRVLIEHPEKKKNFDMYIENQFSASTGQTFISSLEEYTLFRESFLNVKSTLLHPRYISTYSPQVRTIVDRFKKGGLKCCFDYSLCEEPVTMFEDDEILFDDDNTCRVGASDVNRFYLSQFLSLEYLPVFNLDCHFVDFEGAIEEYTLYMVEKVGDEFEYPYYRNDLCYGLQLRKINHDRFVIKKMMRPAHLEVNIMKDLFQNIYDSNLSNAFKKDIGNILMGFLLQKKKNFYKTYHTTDVKEAEGFRRNIGGFFWEFFHKGKSHGYIFNKVFSSRLMDGFYFIGLLYLDATHLYMHDLIRRMKECDVQPFAINVDCVYHVRDDTSKEFQSFKKKYPFYFDYKDKNDFHAIGKLKYEEVNAHEWSEYKIKEFDFDVPVPEYSLSSLPNETIDEIVDVLKVRKRLFVLGQGGMGKSYTLLKALEKIVGKPRILVLSKSWKLTDNWIVQEYASQTIDGFFHYQPTRFIPTQSIKVDDLIAFDAIVIDDIFLNSTYIWHAIYDLMEQFPEKIIVGNGDPYQLDSVFDVFFNAFDGNKIQKMVDMAGRLFGHVIELKKNKRLKTETDRQAYLVMIDIMKNNVSPEVQYQQLSSWMRQHCQVLTDHRQIPHEIKTIITANNNQRERWNNKIFDKVYPKDEWFSVGHVIMYDRGQSTRMKHKMGRFQEFYLKELSEDRVVLENTRTGKVLDFKNDEKNEKKNWVQWVRSHFTYPFGFTCHSWQGSTISDKLLIEGFDDAWINNKWRFTALTRNDNFRDIHILLNPNRHTKFVENMAYYNTIVERCLKADRQRFLSSQINMQRFIDIEWIASQFHDIRVNNRVCSGCGGSPHSPDRIQSHLPHYKSNTRFICVDCNRSKREFN